MFLLSKPTEEKIARFLQAQPDEPFAYLEVGASRATPPSGYTVDHNRIRLGYGNAVWERAIAALSRWEMFNMPWIRLCWPDTGIEAGTVVAVAARHFGFHSLNACRVVYVTDEDGEIRRHGFAYGTLPDHAERGEERFTIEWRRDDDSVWYDILAFSRPNHLLAKVGYPFTRLLQKRFAEDSKRAMSKAAGDECNQGLTERALTL